MRAMIVVGLLAAAAPAAADESLLDTFGRSTGLVAPEPEMPDFVKASRPAAPATGVPVFAPPPEPKSKVKSADELKAMDADLQGAAARSGGAAPAVAKHKARKKTP